MKRNTKGFTLIELLAVIVILAVIALIATPTILGMINRARKSAAESDMLSYVNEIERQILANSMDDGLVATGEFVIADAGKSIVQKLADGTDGEKINLEIKGDRPQETANTEENNTSGFTVDSKGEITLAKFKFGNYYVRYENNNTDIVKCSSTDAFPNTCTKNS